MANKVHEIAFKIAGKISGSFAGAMKNASASVAGFNSKLVALNTEAAQVGELVKQKKAVGEASREYIKAQQRVAELGRQMSQTAEPTKKMAAEFEQAKKAAARAKTTLDKKRGTLREIQTQYGATGQSLQTLIQRQNELAASAEKARAAQAKLNAIMEKQQKAAEMQSKLNAGARSGAAGLVGVAGAATATLGVPVKEAIAMEDAMAEVRKVTDFTPEGLKEVQQQLEMMSTSIPLTADGLAQIMAAAAQSGVAQKDLVGFTEQAAKMGVAFDITAEEAGTMMAKWQSGMKLTQEQTYKLADAVNELSNNNAATAAQVGEVLKRYGALGKVSGLNEKQTAAFAASVVASGAEAEVAATGIKAFMRAMSKGGSMTKKQAGAFQIVGIDPKELQKNLQKDAPAAIIETLEAIQKSVPKEKWNQYLSVMFGEEASVAVAPMMTNLQGLKDNFKIVADEASYSGSMLNEFKARSATTSNALILAKNSALYAARAIGKPLLEPLKQLATQFVAVAVKVGDWIQKNQALVMTGLKVAGVVTGLIAAFFAAKIAIWAVVSPVLSLYRAFLLAQKGIMLLRSGMILSKAAMIATRAVTVASTVAQWALNSAFWACPITWIVAGIAAVVAAGILLWRNWDKVVAFFASAWERIKTATISAAGAVKNAIANVFGGLLGIVKAPMNGVIALVNRAISSINGISVDIPDWVPGVGGKNFGFNIPQIPALANGGIATKPTLAMVGEGNESEAILPLSKLGGMMNRGTSGTSGTGGISVHFAPVINISGGSGDVYTQARNGIEAGISSLKRELNKVLAEQRRLSYT